MGDVQLKKPNRINQWLKLYRLYRAAFPASERKPFGVIIRMYRQNKSDVWCVEKKGHFAGLATTINGNGLILLDYFAVDKAHRGQGIGSGAMEQLQRIYGTKGLFVEIESTQEDAPNQAEREKRKHFYQRAGMAELGVSARVFGVNMELLGSRCSLDFEKYRTFYRIHYGPWAADHIEPADKA